MAMDIIKVLVVDDSAFMRKMIKDILESHVKISVIGTARNGQDALEKIHELDPDVVTLDIEMPIMDGISTLRKIMQDKPRPVIMLSSLTKEGADKTFESMELGAVDFIAKPSGSISLNIREVEAEIKDKVIHARTAKVDKFVPHVTSKPIVKSFSSRTRNISKDQGLIVAIGTSTGGPRALQQVITQIPKDFPAPIVVVQHMPAGFTKSLANRLNQLSQINVKEASDGDVIENGTAYIAPGGYQFRIIKTVEGLKVKITQEEKHNGHQPAVDIMFESLAKIDHKKICAVVMTGMGADGAQGLSVLKSKKEDTVIISEAKETCVVYGMPQAAEKTNLVDFVVKLPDIAETLVNQLKSRGE